jgi:release factor glutamine methyltransferase
MSSTVEPTIEQCLRDLTRALQGVSGSPRLDATLLVGHVLSQRKEWLIAHGETTLTTQQALTLEKLLKLRQKGMPLPYLLGTRAFFDRDFLVTSHVLIPRPETEHLVETALAWSVGRPPLLIADVGTGSGIIALSIAAHLPTSTMIATDVSAAALLVAQQNGASAGLRNVYYAQSDLLAALAGPFDLLCANLPYIASGELDILDVAKFEPLVALDGGPDGLVLFRRFLSQAPTRIKPDGLILLEHGADQGPAVAALAKAAFPNAQVTTIKDLAGLDRIVRIDLGAG